MMRWRACLFATMFLSSLATGSTALAVDICTETVPAMRFIDGLPAYAQCTASNSGAVYSNDGIATATTSGGTGWIRTQSSGGYQCTELAHRYLYFKWNVQSVPNGNAGVWCDGTIPSGLVKTTTPVHGDLIVLAPGSCGADAMTGHVAVIDVANPDATVTAVQQNSASRSKYKLTCAACFLHAVANDNSAPDAGAPVDAGSVDAPATETGAPPKDAAPATDSASALDAYGSGGSSGQGGSSGNPGSGGTSGPTGSGGAGPVAQGGLTGSVGSGGVAGTTSTGGTTGPTGTGGAAPSAVNDEGSGCTCGIAERRATSPWGAIALLGLAVVLTARRRRRDSNLPITRAGRGRQPPAESGRRGRR